MVIEKQRSSATQEECRIEEEREREMSPFAGSKSAEALQRRIHALKVPELDVVVERTGHQPCARRVDAQCRHCLGAVRQIDLQAGRNALLQIRFFGLVVAVVVVAVAVVPWRRFRLRLFRLAGFALHLQQH